MGNLVSDRSDGAGAEGVYGVPSTVNLGRKELASRAMQKKPLGTFNVGFGVFKIKTAHSISVFGVFSSGTTGSIVS